MLKAIGLFLLAVSCTWCGIENAIRYIRHTRCLKEIQSFIHALHTQLCYAHIPTREMLQKALDVIEKKELNPTQISLEGFLLTVKNLPITEAEKQLFSNMIQKLGAETQDAQEDLLKGTEAQFAECIALAKEAEDKNKKLSVMLGVCCGLMLVLLLL